MSSASTKPFAQLLIPNLDAQVNQWRAEGISWEGIAKRLSREGVEVHSTTVYRWYAHPFRGAA